MSLIAPTFSRISLYRRYPVPALAVFWTVGAVLGCAVAITARADVYRLIFDSLSMLRSGGLSLFFLLLPLLLTAVSLLLSAHWIILFLAFFKAYCFSFVSCCFYFVSSDASWILQILFLFLDIVTALPLVLLWTCCIRRCCNAVCLRAFLLTFFAFLLAFLVDQSVILSFLYRLI